jgi:hypothetical protein
MVMVNLMLVNPLNNITMVLIWAGAGLIGGMMAGTKAGGFVVGLMTWLACLGLTILCVYLIFQSGIALGAFVVPPGSSLTDILSIPLIQGMIDQFLPLISGLGGGGGLDIMALLTPLIIWFLTPLIIVIIFGIIGGAVRKKEVF